MRGKEMGGVTGGRHKVKRRKVNERAREKGRKDRYIGNMCRKSKQKIA